MESESKNIVILGSTGSIGENAVKVVKHLEGKFKVSGIAAGSNTKRLAEQAAELNCEYVAVADKNRAAELAENLPESCGVLAGSEGIIEMVTRPEVDLVLCAIVGSPSLIPVLEALKAGKDVALASKEALVMGGTLVMKAAADNGVKILPVDSEHSAVFQCLDGKKQSDMRRIILTASGGPFSSCSRSEMRDVTLEKALAHPTWNMGPKVTIDSATLMNKALEVIEARWLFDIPGDSIDVVIHPQSVIHSMVEFVDGTILAQMGTPDMRFPIQYALTYPEKYPGSLKPLDFAKFAELTFKIPDRSLFPSLDFAYESLRQGGTLPTVMNAANEAAVERFRGGDIKFTDIWKVIEIMMNKHQNIKNPEIEDILNTNKEIKELALQIKV
jgi:1-deoxy-D-xylulose-5-phosphate reductoisomerase